MRKPVFAWAILALYIGFSTPTHAQNLVLNPSFEEMIGCPGPVWLGPTTMDSAMHCFNLNYTISPATPDYNHGCVTLYLSAPYTIFNNGMFIEKPRTGVAMAGFHTYVPLQDSSFEYREYVGMTLSQPLQKDTTYYVSFYVSRADSMGYATDVNIYFAWNIPILDHWNGMDSIPQISSKDVITNHIGWTKIEGSFVAKGGERYLIIGNQYHDDKMKIQYINTYPIANGDTITRAMAYYNVDDVCVSAKAQDCGVSTTSIIETGIHKQMIVYPNPAQTTLYIKDLPPKSMLALYNQKGELVTQENAQNTLSVAHYPEGLYFLHIVTPTQRYMQKIIIQH